MCKTCGCSKCSGPLKKWEGKPYYIDEKKFVEEDFYTHLLASYVADYDEFIQKFKAAGLDLSDMTPADDIDRLKDLTYLVENNLQSRIAPGFDAVAVLDNIETTQKEVMNAFMSGKLRFNNISVADTIKLFKQLK